MISILLPSSIEKIEQGLYGGAQDRPRLIGMD
jgi:hypothetical protein